MISNRDDIHGVDGLVWLEGQPAHLVDYRAGPAVLPFEGNSLLHSHWEASYHRAIGCVFVHPLVAGVRHVQRVAFAYEEWPCSEGHLSGAATLATKRYLQLSRLVERANQRGLLVEDVNQLVRRHGDAGDRAEHVIGISIGGPDAKLLLQPPSAIVVPYAFGRILDDGYAGTVGNSTGPIGVSCRTGADEENGQDSRSETHSRLH